MSHYYYSSPLVFLLHFLCCVASKSDIFTGYQMTLAVPTEYTPGFIGKALLMETHSDHPPSFWTALSVEASNDVAARYSCSLDLFLGSAKVWSSGHRSKFYTAETCVLELTHHGDLRLKDSTNQVGWRTGTTGQGVQKLQLLDTGNLVLVDSLNGIKWQTFNFPTDVLLLGQRLSVATHLVSYPPASSSTTFFYSMEIQHDKLALYVNMPTTGNSSYKDIKYSYWEFEPTKGRNITFVELNSKGLDLFDDAFRKFAQIYYTSRTTGEAVRFMALDNTTGNLGLYYYYAAGDKFETSFEALNSSCDLPLACSNYSVCTRAGGCSCIALSTGKEGEKAEERVSSDCGSGINGGELCGSDREVEMVELQGAVSVLRTGGSVKVRKKEECGELCLNDCECLAVMYRGEGEDCELYNVVRGIKEGGGGELLVKVGKGRGGRNKAGLNKWVLVSIVVADGLVLFIVVGGLGYFFIWKNSSNPD